jgi:DNA-binding MarR family transcriptional regulator
MNIKIIPSDTLTEDVTALDQVMLRLSWFARKQLAQELETYEITVPQYITLKQIKSNLNGSTMKELAEAAQQVSPTMTGIIDRLSERNLVIRVPNPHDRRAYKVSLTDQGDLLLNKIEKHRRERITIAVAVLTDEERKNLIRLMERYFKATVEASYFSHPPKITLE